MKDLDFDELDKAVNSLMAGVPKSAAISDTTEKTVTINSSSDADTANASPLPSQPTRTSASTGTVMSDRSPVPAARRGGRFMDVVHPSSDMKKPEMPVRSVRQATPIEPPKPETPAKATDSKDDVQAEDRTLLKSDWPDPLEMTQFSPQADTDAVVQNTVDSNETAYDDSETKADDEPLVSPFLPDTKVEKRPLGANALVAAAQPVNTDMPMILEDTDSQLPATLEDTKPVLPEELHSDLVAIESDTTGVAEPEKSPEPLQPPIKEEKTPWREAKSAAEGPAKPLMPSGPTSIPQQYSEEVPTGAQENGAIYDTDTYHQPLAHPAKQRSGWMWVVWILLILAIGAGGGAALYFLRLV